MPPTTALVRFNLAATGAGPAERSRLHATMLDLVEVADRGGVDEVTFSEHHATANGSSTSPLVLAAAALARTRRVRVSASALLLPLHDPVRVAEDLATLDTAFPGRLRVVAALGYRPQEYELYRRPFDGRGPAMDEAVRTVLDLWAGGGPGGLPAAAPRSAPGDLLALGGASPAAARRAARFGLPFAPRSVDAELVAAYEAACAAEGVEPRVWAPAPRFVQLHVADDPDATWDRVGPRYLDDAVQYASWQGGGVLAPTFSPATAADELRASGAVVVATPDQAVALLAQGPPTTVCLHPLAGGMPDDEARASVARFVDHVLPHLDRPPEEPSP